MKNVSGEKEKKNKKSKTTQLSHYDIIPINSLQLQTSDNDEYPFLLNTDKNRLEKEKQFYFSKTKFYDKNKKKQKNLIIDTRSTPLNLINPKKYNKFNFVDYRHKKYIIHKFPFNNNSQNESYEKNNNIINNNDENSTKEENLSLEEKIKNMKYQFIKAPINGYLPNFALNYDHLPHRAVGNSLYTVMAMRKNQFVDAYNQTGEKEYSELPRLKQMQFLLNTSNNSPMSSYFGRKDEYRKYVDLMNQPFSYISLLNNDFSISEKMRFQKMMDKLNKVKKCIEEKPDQEFEIAKEFILGIGLYDITNLDIDKLNNFLNFIKSDFLIDPSKNMKENIFNILNRNNLHKPSMSKALDCINEDYILNEIRKRKNLIKHKKIGEIFNSFNETYSDFINSKINENKENSNLNIKNKIKTLNTYLEENKNYNTNKKIKSKTINNKRFKQRPLEHKGLCIDLKRQQEINLLQNKKDLDLVNSPKIAVDMIKKEIISNNKKDKLRAKTHYNWCRNIYKNKRLYGGRRQENAEYNEIKKKNMLTEYICLMKAKNNMKLSKLKEIYKL